MTAHSPDTDQLTHTSYKVVLPFYIYASFALITACVLLLWAIPEVTGHYFQPKVLAITHTMALGWGTMIILGASHQLLPVLVEKKIYSHALAYTSFMTAAAGIPLLVYAFHIFNMGWPAITGGILINVAILAYVINLAATIADHKEQNIHARYLFTASLWLLATTVLGLLLVLNFTSSVLPKDSLHYLSLHAHIGIVGWFLLLVMGAGSRLLPMFLVSKYNSSHLLKIVYIMLNAGLLTFVSAFLYFRATLIFLLAFVLVLSSIGFFVLYCYRCFKNRIRGRVELAVRFSMASTLMIILPAIFIILMLLSSTGKESKTVLAYGFTIFFGWLTAVIFGMTFKTLPFIIWVKCFHDKIGLIETPDPKKLYNRYVFVAMLLLYCTGFVLFLAGILLSAIAVLKIASLVLLLAALLYGINIFKLVLYKAS